MEDNEKSLQQASIVLSGAIDEISTVQKYLSALSELLREPPANAEEIKAQYAEIISDEFNHLVRFTGLAVDMLGIEIKES